MARTRIPSCRVGVAVPLLFTACALAAAPSASAGQEPVGATMNRLYAPVEIGADIDVLPASERAALSRIVDAARVMDALFLEQVWAGNSSMLMALLDDRSPTGRARLDYFLLNKGPWSRLEGDRSFVAGAPPKPAGAAYYPPDATRDEVSSWMDGLTGDARQAATGFFTTIRRGPGGGLRAVPYSVEYEGPLAVAAGHLRAAAELTAEPTLASYLRARAAAFASNDYYESDVAWMQLDAAIEPTVGPYEVYEDGWFNFKAAFEAFVTIRDAEETEQLARFGAELQGLENALPIDAAYRDPEIGALAPIRVVNVIFTAGDANSGVQTAAFNLPNDERVIRDHGSKRVMLKNVQEAKFRHVLAPIAEVALPAAEQSDVAFDAFFTHILMHELMHGLGPQEVQGDGRATTVRQALREASSVIEEAKADISGLWALHRLIDEGVIDRSLERSIYTTFLASAFRSIRFGINAAHGRGVAIQLNTFLDAGAVTVDAEGRFAVEHGRIREAVEGLARRLMTIQAHGDYDEAIRVMDTLGVVRPEVQRVLDRLGGVPVDIRPRYVTAEELARPDGRVESLR